MSKKDYIKVAETIAALSDKGEAFRMARVMREVFAADNPRFVTSTFYEACGVAQ